jgi:hypothetical protein
MTPDVPRRRAIIAYAAGVAVIAGLMTIVALSGSGISARKSMSDLSPHVAAMKQP